MARSYVHLYMCSDEDGCSRHHSTVERLIYLHRATQEGTEWYSNHMCNPLSHCSQCGSVTSVAQMQPQFYRSPTLPLADRMQTFIETDASMVCPLSLTLNFAW